MSGAKGLEPGTSLLTGGFLTLIPAQTCVSSYFQRETSKLRIFSEYDPFERRSLYVHFSPVHPAHDRMADDTPGALFCLPYSADSLWGRICVLFCTGFGKKYGPWHRLNRISAIFSFPVEYFLHSWNSISRHFYMSSNFTGISTGGISIPALQHSHVHLSCCTAPSLRKNTSPRRHLPSGFRAAGRNHGPGCAARTHASVLDNDAPWLPLAFYSALPWTFILYVRHRRT